MSKIIKVAHSPDSDDAFMFYAIANQKIDLKGYEFEITSDEIEKLNENAIETEDYDICAVSFHAYAYVANQYQVLKAGSSMGDKNYGPRLVAREGLQETLGSFIDLSDLRVAIPGEFTSAFLCLCLYQRSLMETHKSAKDFTPVFCAFDEVFDLVKDGQVDAGLLIHESQLKFEEEKLNLLIDLGKWWHDSTPGFAMPLGCNVIRRSLGEEAINDISEILQESIKYGMEHFEDALKYARDYSKNGLDDAKAKEYISMYVNEHTLELSKEDLESIRTMLERAYSKKLLNLSNMPVLDPV